jgi:hypothetical protein
MCLSVHGRITRSCRIFLLFYSVDDDSVNGDKNPSNQSCNGNEAETERY